MSGTDDCHGDQECNAVDVWQGTLWCAIMIDHNYGDFDHDDHEDHGDDHDDYHGDHEGNGVDVWQDTLWCAIMDPLACWQPSASYYHTIVTWQ